ncbi:MAG: DUF3592 domain-containing protein [Planctomycetota bacterium]
MSQRPLESSTDDAPIQARPSRWLPIGGAVAVLIAIGIACVYAWVLQTPHASAGQQLLLMGCAPVMAVMIIGLASFGASMIWQGMTRYRLSLAGLETRTPRRRSFLRWAEAEDFNLTGGHFPDPPSSLEVRDRSGHWHDVPMDPACRGDWQGTLLRAVPGLEGHGLDRVRETTRGCKAIRWIDGDKVAGSGVAVLAGACLLPLLMLGGYAITKRHINYQRIVANPIEVSAVIDEIEVEVDGDDVDVRATVTYTGQDGVERSRRRLVFSSFRDDFNVGDTVTVQHVRDRPTVMRIKDWDRDAREWMLILFVVPLLWLCLAAVVGGIASMLMPTREPIDWVPVEAEEAEAPGVAQGHYMIAMNTSRMETLVRLFPDRHRGGALAVLSLDFPELGSSRDQALVGHHQRLDRAGVHTALIGESFLAASAQESGVWTDRMRREPWTEAAYAVLESSDRGDAERWLLRQSEPSSDGPEPAEKPDLMRGLRFARLPPFVGPVAAGELAELQLRWLGHHLEKLLQFRVPPGVTSESLARVVSGWNPREPALLTITKWGRTLRLYVAATERGRARLYEFTDGSWHDMGETGIPKVQGLGCFTWATLIAMSPLLVVVAPVVLLVGLPFKRWEKSRRRKKLAEARAALATPEAE